MNIRFLKAISNLNDAIMVKIRGPSDNRDHFPKEIHSTYHSCCSRSCCCNLHCLLVTSKLGAAAETEAVVKFVEAETEAEKIVKLKIYLNFSDI